MIWDEKTNKNPDSKKPLGTNISGSQTSQNKPSAVGSQTHKDQSLVELQRTQATETTVYQFVVFV